MSDVKVMLNKMNITQAEHLPVVAAFCRKIGLADTVNNAVPTEMSVDVGTVVKFMVLDTLSGRSPLYRLERFARSVDTGLLLGKNIPAQAFNDTTLGRTLDACLCQRQTGHLRGGDRTALLPDCILCSKGVPLGARYGAPTL